MNAVAVVKAHTDCPMMLAHVEAKALGVPDGGADSVIGGPVWLVHTPLSGPLVKFANAISFDATVAKKTGLPIIAGAAKAVAASGKVLMLRAKHMICNPTSPHTLLSTHQMRQAGVIVDDVAKHHRKDEHTLGTQAMHFPEKGEKIDFHLKAALFTFELQKPTMEEHLNWPEEDIIDIAVEDWNPQEHR